MHSPLIILAIYFSAIFSPELVVLFCLFLFSVATSLIILRRIPLKNIFKQHISNGIKASILVASSTIVSAILVQILKHIFSIPRPATMLVQETGYRFPSGHAAVSVACIGMAIVCLHTIYKHWPRPIKYLCTVLGILSMIGVSSSRLILGVHKPVDIYAGAGVGLISVAILFYIYKRLSYDETTSNKNLG